MKYRLSEKEIFEYRPKPFYFLTVEDQREYTYKKVKKSLHNLKRYGFGGFVLFNKPPKGFTAESYLTDKWFAVVKTFAAVSRELKLSMWINDGFDFPPGSVAGKVEKIAPHLKQKSIYRDKDGNLAIKEADWGFPAFEEPLSSELFVKLVYEEYEKHVGEYFVNTIKGFFSDGDNRRVLYTVMRDENSPMRNYFPWATDFEKDFIEEYGYDIIPHINDVFDRNDTEYARDYWEFCGKLYQRWNKGNYEWLKSRGLEYTGHTGDTSPFLQTEVPRSSAFTEGRFSDVQSNFDYPGTDQELYAIDGGKHMRIEAMYTPNYVWGEKELHEKMTDFSQVKYDTRAKQAGSTAYLYGKKGAMCEMFAATNYGVSPETLKQIAAYQIMQGVTFMVPHAYYYRMLDRVKHFAPPDFAENSMLKHADRIMFDEMSFSMAMLNKGEKVYPIALVDPTDSVWRNNFNKEEYFTCFEKLNRMPQGFVIADIKKILSGNYPFKVAIFAGIKLTEQEISELKSKGITPLSSSEIELVGELIKTDVKWVGEGEPHFARRIIDGVEFTFVSNIESVKPINGTLYAYGKKVKTTLYPGDIKYLSKRYTNLVADKRKGELVKTFDGEVSAKFEDDNLVLLERFEVDGKPVLKTESNVLNFNFKAEQDIENLKILIPCLDENKLTVCIDGKKLASKQSMVMDEKYRCFAVDKVKSGKHAINIVTVKPFRSFDRLLLEGDFDIFVRTDKTEYKHSFSEYNLSLFIPEKATVKLSKRRDKLSLSKSWAEQGQLFYSGKTEYFIDGLDLDKGNYTLELPKARDVVTLKVNGKAIKKLVYPPYSFDFKVINPNTRISIEVINSHANAIEGYAEESGIFGGVKIYKK